MPLAPAAPSGTFDPAAEIVAGGRPQLQARLRVWGKVTTFVHLGFWAAWLASHGGGVDLSRDALLVMALSVATVVYAAAWLVGAGPPRALTWLKAQDFCSFALLGGTFALGLAGHPVPHQVAYEALTGMMFLLFTRALLFPTSPWHTLLVCLLTGLPPVVVAFVLRGRLAAPGLSPASYWMSYVSWTVISSGVCTVASGVLYGLGKKVHDARRLGQYVLLEKLGSGGMGVVYRASHALLRRPTAIKLLANRAAQGATVRFEQEVRLMAQLSHPNIVTVHDYGRTSAGAFYYAMELLEGMDLERLVEHAGRQPPGRVVHVLRQAASALGRAHRAGLVHRDVKPANIFLCRDWGEADAVKVLDFGLVKDLNAAVDPGLTLSERLLGTPLYMSPEACTAPLAVDARSDLYSLGAVAHFMLTGEPPFVGDNVVEIAAQHIHAPLPPLTGRTMAPLSPQLEQVVTRCLEKDPARRWAGAEALGEALSCCPESVEWSSALALEFWASRAAIASEAGPARSATPLDTVEIEDLLLRPRPQRRDAGTRPHGP